MSSALFFTRALVVVGLVVLAAALFLIALEAIPVLLLIFLAILLAVFLRALAGFVCNLTGWRFRWGLIAVLAVILGLSALGGVLLGPNAAAQLGNVMNRLPEVRNTLQQYGWSGLLYHVPGMEDLLSGRLDIWQRLTKSFSFSETFGPLISIGLVIVIGLYLAASPEPYVKGAVMLWPAGSRGKFRAVLLDMGDTLRWWLIGQAMGMLYIGVLVVIGLKLMSMPLATTLGIFAGLMAFIPNVGYVLSIAPAVLLAILKSPFTAFGVLVLYTAAHWSNDYLVIPLVQKRTIHLPPALTISMQLMLGFLLGGIGLLIATPLTAVLLVAVKGVYLRNEPHSPEAHDSG